METKRGSNLKSKLKKIIPSMDPNLPGAKQKVAFNLNRFVLLIIILIYTATSSCIYFDWSAVRKLLLKVNKYSYLNNGDKTDITKTPQYHKINSLYPITFAVHFTMSAFCGFLYDHIGPKFTAILGQTFNILSWIFLSLKTNENTPDYTLLGFIFMGLGADTSFIPILTVVNLFPDASTFIITIIGAAASLSFAVPAILNIIANQDVQFVYICFGYILFILVPCLLTAILFVPVRPFKALDYYENENISRTSVENAEKKKSFMETELLNIDNNKAVNNTIIKNKQNDNIILNYNSGELIEKKKSSIKAQLDDEDKNNKNKNIFYINIFNKKTVKIDMDYHLKNLKMFFYTLITYPSICIIVYFVLFNISIVFYGMVNETYFYYYPTAISIINILFPLSSIPCIIMGRMINKYGAAVIILFMNMCSALMHLNALIENKVSAVFSIIFYIIANSMFTSQIYCFIQNAFPSELFGKFVGFISMCGGLCSLFCELIYNYIVENTGKDEKIDPKNAGLALVILFIFMFLPLNVLYNRKYEKIIEKETNLQNKKKEIMAELMPTV